MNGSHLFYIFVALAGYATCKSFHKREINRDTKVDVIGPVVESHRAHLYRHLVQIRYRCNRNCGGTILSDRHVLTAAHCVIGMDPREMTITAGITRPFQEGGQIRDVFAISIHDGYQRRLLFNDIAILTLQEPLNVTKLTVAKLPEVDADFKGSVVDVAGWGHTNNLTYGYFTITNHPACTEPSQMCTRPLPGMMIFKGDSGSSVVLRNGSDVVLVGIVSGEIYEGPQVNETLFANVAHLRTWIDDSIAETEQLFKIGRRYLSKLPKNYCAIIDEAVTKVVTKW